MKTQISANPNKIGIIGNYEIRVPSYMTRSRKRGHFPQNSYCELDTLADSTNSAIHTREKQLTLARHVPCYSPLSFILVFTLVSRYHAFILIL